MVYRYSTKRLKMIMVGLPLNPNEFYQKKWEEVYQRVIKDEEYQASYIYDIDPLKSRLLRENARQRAHEIADKNVVNELGSREEWQEKIANVQNTPITDLSRELLNEVASQWLKNDVSQRNHQRKQGRLVLPIDGDEKAVDLSWILIDPWHVYFTNADSSWQKRDLQRAEELSTSDYHLNGMNSPWIENDPYVAERPWLRTN